MKKQITSYPVWGYFAGMKGFLSALSFMTVIRISVEFDGRAAVKFFPLVGAIVGTGLYVLSFIPAPFRGYLMVLYLTLITGGLHLDGLADSCDAFFSHRDRSVMLDIMKDSHIGTFGVLSLIFVVLGKILCFNTIKNPLFFILVPVYGRFVVVYLMKKLPYARESGTAKDFFKPMKFLDFSIGLLFVIASFYFFYGFKIVLINLSFFLWGFFLFSYFKRKIGGITGDMLGFSIETTELFLLFLGVYYGF